MTNKNVLKIPKYILILAVAIGLFWPASDGAVWALPVYDCQVEENLAKPAKVEMTLAKKWRKKAKEVKQAFSNASGPVKVRLNFFPFLDPPTNIGIGKCVSADMARLAIRNAIHYNGGVDKLVLQHILPHHWIGIGTTKLAELSWMPISAEDLSRLMNPNLSDADFHGLYRELARMTERKQPFGMDPIPYDFKQEKPSEEQTPE